MTLDLRRSVNSWTAIDLRGISIVVEDFALQISVGMTLRRIFKNVRWLNQHDGAAWLS
jgi:hypothetical protein